jgi:hypothetical protein
VALPGGPCFFSLFYKNAPIPITASPVLLAPSYPSGKMNHMGQINMTTATDTQSDLFAWAKDLERENKRIAEINAQRVRNRGYLVFATDPSVGVDSAEYQQVYATEARTPNQAIAKVRPLAEGRRLQAFLTTGKYRDELADARWVA